MCGGGAGALLLTSGARAGGGCDKLSPREQLPSTGTRRGELSGSESRRPAPALRVGTGVRSPGRSPSPQHYPYPSTTSQAQDLPSGAPSLQPEALAGGLARRGSSGSSRSKASPGRLGTLFRGRSYPYPAPPDPPSRPNLPRLGLRPCGTAHCAPEGRLQRRCDPGAPVWVPPAQVTWFSPDPPHMVDASPASRARPRSGIMAEVAGAPCGKGRRLWLHLPRGQSQGRGPSGTAQLQPGPASRAALALCRGDVAWAVGARCLLGIVVWSEVLSTRVPAPSGCAPAPERPNKLHDSLPGASGVICGLRAALCLLVYEMGSLGEKRERARRSLDVKRREKTPGFLP